MAIDTTQQPEVQWLHALREALEVPSRERRVSRRAVLGVGITSLAALGGMGLAGKLLFFTPPPPDLYLPIGHQPTATALPGSSRIRWKFSLYPQPFGSHTSVFLAGRTLVCSDAGNLTALNSADGKFLWIQRDYNINHEVPPTVVGDSIYVTYNNPDYTDAGNGPTINKIYLAVFNLSDGSERWHQFITSNQGDATNTSAVTVAGNSAYVRYNQTLFACDATTGKPLWSQSAGGLNTELGEILPAPTIAGERVFAVLGDRKLHAFSASNGAPLWPAPFAADLPIRTQPVVANGVVYVGADGGWCYALDAMTGAVRWKSDLFAKSHVEAASDRAPYLALGLTLSANVLYISGGFPLDSFNGGSERHEPIIQALDHATGKIIWSSEPSYQLNFINLALLADLFKSTPLVVGNTVFQGSRVQTVNGQELDILFALNARDGKVKWTFHMWGSNAAYEDYQLGPSAPIISGDTLYIISGDEMLYAISYAD